MAERDDAIKLANLMLQKADSGQADPDGDLCVLARQFLHEIERSDKARYCLGFFQSVIKTGEPWTPACEEEFRKVFPR